MTTPYTAGTVTLTNGSAVITGIGTAWQTALIVGGIVIAEADGNPLPILTVDSNTQITAAIKWKGATGTYPYAIMRDTTYGQQTVANAQALANYLARLDTATLSALNSLGPSMVADRVPYATSNAAMAWAPFTAYGRTLVAATSDTTFASAAKVVRRSGGANMSSTNDIMLGWHQTLGGLISQVDGVYLGNIWNDYYATAMGGGADIRSKIGAYSASGGVIGGNATVTGFVQAGSTITAPWFALNSTGAQEGSLTWQTNGMNRWNIDKAAPTSEGGSNSGGDLRTSRWNDAGGYLGTPISISRRYGTVETRETPLAIAYAGSGQQSVLGGQHIGVLGSAISFDFLRGGSGSAPTIGGNPGAGGRAVHIAVSAWYKITACAVLNGNGTVFGLGLNGGSWVAMYSPSPNWTTLTRVVSAYLTAGAYLSWTAIIGTTSISLENSSVTIEFIQF